MICIKFELVEFLKKIIVLSINRIEFERAFIEPIMGYLHFSILSIILRFYIFLFLFWLRVSYFNLKTNVILRELVARRSFEIDYN